MRGKEKVQENFETKMIDYLKYFSYSHPSHIAGPCLAWTLGNAFEREHCMVFV